MLLSTTGLLLASAHCKPKPAVQLKTYRPPPCPTRGLAANKAAPIAMKITASTTFLITATHHLELSNPKKTAVPKITSDVMLSRPLWNDSVSLDVVCLALAAQTP